MTSILQINIQKYPVIGNLSKYKRNKIYFYTYRGRMYCLTANNGTYLIKNRGEYKIRLSTDKMNKI